jgi:hypothetical protein
MAAAFGLVLATMPLLLSVCDVLSLQWLVMIFLGGTGLSIAIAVGALL